MKKILLTLSVAGLFSLTACNNDDDYVDHDTYPEVIELSDVDFSYNANLNKYAAFYDLNPDIYYEDSILIYRLDYDPDGSVDVWQLIPRTIYQGADEIDYDYNFTQSDVLFLMDANFDLALAPELTQNQVFRIVIVPGYIASTVDVEDYDAVMSAINAEGKAPVHIEKR